MASPSTKKKARAESQLFSLASSKAPRLESCALRVALSSGKPRFASYVAPMSPSDENGIQYRREQKAKRRNSLRPLRPRSPSGPHPPSPVFFFTQQKPTIPWLATGGSAHRDTQSPRGPHAGARRVAVMPVLAGAPGPVLPPRHQFDAGLGRRLRLALGEMSESGRDVSSSQQGEKNSSSSCTTTFRSKKIHQPEHNNSPRAADNTVPRARMMRPP